MVHYIGTMTIKRVKKPEERSPVVVVMGHVDHGKTKMLDAIRKTNVVDKEAGGITQSIGAYEIVHGGKRITFIDTPGHEAFSRMRQRGARVADIAILVVAADDGVKEQTKEAIMHIKAAQIPFIVAINKVDKSNADVDRTKRELLDAGVFLEGMGGDISYQEVSAKAGQGIGEMLDLLLIAVELQNLTYDPAGDPAGIVIEARTDPQRGTTASVILKNGTLKVGEAIVTATARGKIRIMESFFGKRIKLVKPSAPALLVGFDELPLVGEEFIAGRAAEEEMRRRREEVTIALRLQPFKTDKEHVYNIIVRADVSGSAEALVELLKGLGKENIEIRIVDFGVGEITNGDVNLAISTGSIIAAFNVKVHTSAENLAKNNHIAIFASDVIYRVLKAVEEEIKRRLPREPLGVMKVLATFRGIEKRQVVGGKITAGEIKNKAAVEIWRREKKAGSGTIVNLQSQRKDVDRIEKDNEAGILFEGDVIIKEGDELRFY